MKIHLPKYQKVYSAISCLFLIAFLLNLKNSYAQLIVTPAANPGAAQNLVTKVIVGTGVTVGNITYSGQFSGNVSQIGEFSTGAIPTNLGIDNGIIMSTGDVNKAPLPNNDANVNNYHNYFCDCEVNQGDSKCIQNKPGCQWSDLNLDAILGCALTCTFDAVNLQFDFTPSSNQVKFRYVFASDEYPLYVCSSTNDAFAFLVTGPKPGGGNYTNENIALVPGKNEAVTINTVNSGACGTGYSPCATCDLNNSAYYTDNKNGLTITYNAFTKVMTAQLDVIPCQKYHIKLVLADVVDGAYDSSVFIEAKSFTVKKPVISFTKPLLDDSAAIKGCSNATVTFTTFNNRPPQSDSVVTVNFGGTAFYGSDYVTVPAGITNSITMTTASSQYSFQIQPICPGSQPGKDLYILFSVLTCGIATTDTIRIRELPQITATPSPDVTICAGNPTNLSVTSVTGGTGNYTYSWSPATALTATNIANPVANPTVTTTYTVTISDECGTCHQKTYSIVVTVSNPTVTIAAGGPTTFCPGDNVDLNATTGGPGYTYQWHADVSGNINGATNSTYNASSADTYYVIVTDPTGCIVTSNTITVTIASPTATITPEGPTSFCKRGSVVLDANFIVGYNYQWQRNGVDINGATNSTLSVDSAGMYTFIISKGANCSATSLSTIIIVNPVPVATIIPDKTFIVCNDTAITVSANLDPNYRYQWQKNGGNLDGATSNIFTFGADQAFYTVIETDNIGCTGSDTIYVERQCPPLLLYIPTAFTPNNKLLNTYFLPIGSRIANFSMEIYNRMGGKIFHTDDILIGWDGKYNGTECPMGAYVYLIKYEGYIDNHYVKQTKLGSVTLVR
jgi:gliding motility-associated-like protein